MGDIVNYKLKLIKAKISKGTHFILNYLKKTSKKVQKRFFRRIYKIIFWRQSSLDVTKEEEFIRSLLWRKSSLFFRKGN